MITAIAFIKRKTCRAIGNKNAESMPHKHTMKQQVVNRTAPAKNSVGTSCASASHTHGWKRTMNVLYNANKQMIMIVLPFIIVLYQN